MLSWCSTRFKVTVPDGIKLVNITRNSFAVQPGVGCVIVTMSPTWHFNASLVHCMTTFNPALERFTTNSAISIAVYTLVIVGNDKRPTRSTLLSSAKYVLCAELPMAGQSMVSVCQFLSGFANVIIARLYFVDFFSDSIVMPPIM